jgi:hypothetical protein
MKKQYITKQAAPAGKAIVTTAPLNEGGFENFQTTVSRKQRIETQKKGAEEVKKEEPPPQVVVPITQATPVIQTQVAMFSLQPSTPVARLQYKNKESEQPPSQEEKKEAKPVAEQPAESKPKKKNNKKTAA